jgi:hypothetical protein
LKTREEVDRRFRVRDRLRDVQSQIIETKAQAKVRAERAQVRECARAVLKLADPWTDEPSAADISKGHPLRAASPPEPAPPAFLVEQAEQLRPDFTAVLDLAKRETFTLCRDAIG